MKRVGFVFLLTFLVVPPVFAVEVAPRISDRVIIDKLSGLDAKIDKEMANVRGDIKKLEAGQAALQQQISDLKESTNKRFDDVNRRFDDQNNTFNKRFDTLQWMLGLFITAAFSLMVIMGRVLWNQQIKLTQIETSLEVQKAEITFVKTLIEKLQTLIEKLIPPRGVL